MLEFLLAAAALAPETPAAAPAPDSTELRETQARAEAITLSPPNRALNLMEGADVSLEISEKKSELTLSYAWDGDRRRLTSDGRGIKVSRTTLDLALTLPIGGADNLLAGETFDGFSAGPSITASWTWFGWTSRDRFDGEAFGRIMERAVRNCISREDPALRAERCEPYRGRPNAAFAEKYSGYSRAKINRSLLSPAFGFGIEGELGFDEFKYRTPLTLSENKSTKPNFSAAASIFYFPSDGVSLFAGSVEYENKFKARDDEILCKPVIANPNDDCVNAPSDGPRKAEQLSLAVEYRRVLGSVQGLGRFAVAPKASYDVMEDGYSVEVPFYLSLERDSTFLPGLSFSYDSEDNEFVVGLFLRKAFSLGR